MELLIFHLEGRWVPFGILINTVIKQVPLLLASIHSFIQYNRKVVVDCLPSLPRLLPGPFGKVPDRTHWSGFPRVALWYYHSSVYAPVNREAILITDGYGLKPNLVHI